MSSTEIELSADAEVRDDADRVRLLQWIHRKHINVNARHSS